MSLLLKLAFLFFIGSVVGWCAELLFRRFFSKANPERKWINPGFCTGPYLPLYGTGLCILYLISSLDRYPLTSIPALNKALLLVFMSLCLIALEYLTGLVLLKVANIRLWDYSAERFNVNGIICPKFSLAWVLIGITYYFLIDPYIKELLDWLSQNLAFSFFIGLFFGVFIIDAVQSMGIVSKLADYAKEKDIIVRYENVKAKIKAKNAEYKQKYHFFRPFKTDIPLRDILNEMKETLEQKLSSHTQNKK